MFGKKWNPRGQHCYVTGGSSGLGLSVAQELTRAGAHVSIVARDEGRLATALKSLEALRQNPGQILASYSFSLDQATASGEAIDAASVPHGGRVPDAFFLCVGTARPGFALEMTEEALAKGMSEGYWVQAWSAFAASKKMVTQGVKGRIVFVGSTLSYMTFVGWSSYAPAKNALRGLADTLRSEMLLYDISIHMFFPNTMTTPGLEIEQQTKPAITLKIEEGDAPVSPDQAARSLIKGVRNGEAHISGDLLTSIFRGSTRGGAPYTNTFMTVIYDIIALIGVPIWRRGTDAKIRAHKAEHAAYLKTKNIA